MCRRKVIRSRPSAFCQAASKPAGGVAAPELPLVELTISFLMVSCGARVVTGADETSLNGSPKLFVRAAVAMFRKSRRSATESVVAVTVNRRSKTEGPEGVNAGVLKFKEFCAGSTLKLKLGRRGTSVSSGPRPNRPGGGMSPRNLVPRPPRP